VASCQITLTTSCICAVVYGVCNARVLSSNIVHAFEFSFREIYNKKFRYRKKHIAHRRYRQDKKKSLQKLHFKMFAF